MSARSESDDPKPFKLTEAIRANALSDLGEVAAGKGSANALAAKLAETEAHGIKNAMASIGGADGVAKMAAEADGFKNALAAHGRATGLAKMAKDAHGFKNALAAHGGVDGLAKIAAEATKTHAAFGNALARSDLFTNAAEVARNAAAAGATMKNALAAAGLGGDIQERMKELQRITGSESTLGKVALDIAAQQRSVDALAARASEVERSYVPPPIHIPKIENPLIETNKRLARIEKRFELVSEIAKDSAQTAVGLQAAAAEFLQKFERAAEDTNKSGNKAILVALLAVVITLFQTASPYMFPNEDAAALRQTVAELTGEVASMRAEQAATSQALIDALAAGDQATANAVVGALEAALSTKAAVEVAE